jgi:asparagine synthase (glutamine-hydrolysing)
VFAIARLARKSVTVALTGDGGDEVFAGYRRFYQIRRMEWLARRGLIPVWRGVRRIAVAVENATHPGRPSRTFPATRADQMLALDGVARYQHLLAFFSDSEKEGIVMPYFRERAGRPSSTDYLEGHFDRPGDDILNRYLYLDLTTYLPEDILFKVDVTSMASSLECRSPFLDYKLIEFAATLPGGYKLSAAGRHKHILKEAFAAWLPPGFMDRPKKGFSVPLSRWLKEDLADMMRDTLVSKKTLARWFRQDVVARFVEEHVSGRASHTNRLWPLFVLALWVDRYRVPV